MQVFRKSGMPTVYRESTKHRMKQVFLPDDMYEAALRSFVCVNTDCVIVSKTRRTFWLAKRAVKPMPGNWIIGGREFAGELPAHSMQRNFNKETGIWLPESRFQFVMMTRYLWKDREQEPQDAGSDNLAYTFMVELSDEEVQIVAGRLERKEYEAGYGLREFSRTQMIAAKVHPVLVDLHYAIFPVAD